eukprot:c39193_g1_i1.p1 GENE.c39193_g1_i1~~c39193_g1_i1.p1  ORF type:complete len:423 (+),score=14.43 c39193_g1_i1:28-1269(+)
MDAPLPSTLQMMRETLPGTVLTIAGKRQGKERRFDGDCLNGPALLAAGPFGLSCFVISQNEVLWLDYAANTVTPLPCLNSTVISLCLSPCGKAVLYGRNGDIARCSLETQAITLLAGQFLEARGAIDGSGKAASCGRVMAMCATSSAGGRSSAYFCDDTCTIRCLTIHAEDSGTISTIAGSTSARGLVDGIGAAAQFIYCNAIALSQDEDLLFVGQWTAVRMIQIATGAVRTLAGGPVAGYGDGVGDAAKFNGIRGLAVAPDGTIFCADTLNHCVRAVNGAGQVTTIVGNRGYTANPEPVPLASASVNTPSGLALAPGGGLVVSSQTYHNIRYLAGVYSVSQRFRIHCPGHLPVALLRVFQTLAVLWDGRSERLSALAVPGIRRENTLHQARFEVLLQWVQGALWRPLSFAEP